MRRLPLFCKTRVGDPAPSKPSQLHRRLAWVLPVVASACLLRAWLLVTTIDTAPIPAPATAAPMVDLATALAAIEPGAGPVTGLPEGLDPKALLAVADELKRRREEVERRERSLAEREAALKQVEPRLAAQIAQLEDLKIALEGLLERVSEEEEQRLARLVKLYESMKPKKAAPIFEQREPTHLLPVVRRMREAKVAAIIEEMDPLIAKALTAELGRSQPVPGIAGSMEEHVANGPLSVKASRMP